MRKEAGYEVIDRISVSLTGDLASRIITLYSAMIAEDTLADSVVGESLTASDIERMIEVEGGEMGAQIKRSK